MGEMETANVLTAVDLGVAQCVVCEGALTRYRFVAVLMGSMILVTEYSGKWSFITSHLSGPVDQATKPLLVKSIVSQWDQYIMQPRSRKDAEVIADALIQVFGKHEVEGE